MKSGPSTHPFFDQIEKEVRRVEGAGIAYDFTGKHPRAILTLNGQTRFVVFSATPRAAGAKWGCARNIRHALKGMANVNS
jgi:hypothetical protein